MSLSVGEYVSKWMFRYDDLEITEGDKWFVYFIKAKGTQKTYIGSTPTPRKRLRQHNRLLVGGAKSTKRATHWRPICLLSGFETKIQALQFEWAWKHQRIRGVRRGGLDWRIKSLLQLLNKERWTKRAPIAKEIPLIIYADPKISKDISKCPQHVEFQFVF